MTDPQTAAGPPRGTDRQTAAGPPRRLLQCLCGPLLPALPLVMATIYAPFAITSQLGALPGADPADLMILKIVLLMVAGTGLSAVMTATPLAVAPAVGLTAFFIAGRGVMHDPAELYLCSMLAGAITFILCVVPFRGTSMRRHILDYVLPGPVKQGVKGGVGALLAEKSVEHILRGDGHDTARILVVSAGAAVLLALLLFDAYRNLSGRSVRGTGLGDATLLSLPFVAVPVLIFAFCMLALPGAGDGAPPSPGHHAARLLPRLLHGFRAPHLPDGPDVMNVVTFTMVIVFVFLTDIAGTPSEMLRIVRLAGNGCATDMSDHARRAIRNSLWVDGIMSIVNATMQVPPSVYYVENLVLKNDSCDDHLLTAAPAAWYCAILLGAVAGLLCWAPISIDDLAAWSGLAVAPILLTIGIKIVARSFETEHAGAGSAPRRLLAALPTTLTIVLTPIIDLQLSIPIGILAYCVAALIQTSRRGAADAGLVDAGLADAGPEGTPAPGTLWALLVVAAVVLLFGAIATLSAPAEQAGWAALARPLAG